MAVKYGDGVGRASAKMVGQASIVGGSAGSSVSTSTSDWSDDWSDDWGPVVVTTSLSGGSAVAFVGPSGVRVGVPVATAKKLTRKG